MIISVGGTYLKSRISAKWSRWSKWRWSIIVIVGRLCAELSHSLLVQFLVAYRSTFCLLKDPTKRSPMMFSWPIDIATRRDNAAIEFYRPLSVSTTIFFVPAYSSLVEQEVSSKLFARRQGINARNASKLHFSPHKLQRWK